MQTAPEPSKRTWSDDMRVYLAAERTLLAWIRTGLALMGFGFLVARFGLFLRELAAVRGVEPQESAGMSLWLGTALVVLGIGVNLFAAWQHVPFVRWLRAGEESAMRRGGLAIVFSLILAALGAVTAVYLVLSG